MKVIEVVAAIIKDSDSTGSITGNILGAYIGIDNIPEKWAKNVELMDVTTKMADELFVAK